MGTSVLLPSSSGDSKPWPFQKAGQNLVGGLNKTFDRLPKLFDTSLSRVSEPDMPRLSSTSRVFIIPSARPRAIFHPSSGRTAVDRRSPC
ncbi:MAG: hypothetical protein ACLR0N_10005 [Bilophila wadsworthia]